MSELITITKKLSSDIFNEVVNFRRHFHQYPELSFQEYETASFIINQLKKWSIDFKSEIAGNGIVAKIKGDLRGEKTIAFRSDMDALPILEQNKETYSSVNPGVMHACGHDVHMANLLGTIWVVSQLKSKFGGTAMFIFQPAEEKYPGGAKAMVDAGIFNETMPNHCLGLHVYPELPAGQLGFKSGMHMASVDEIYMTIKGKGGHAALPHKAIDVVLISSHIITSLQQVVSRLAPPDIPSVLSFGKVIANGACNVLPDRVEVEGTFRTMNEPWRKLAKEKMIFMAQSIAESMGGSCKIEIKHGYPALVNDKQTTQIAKSLAKEYLEADKVHDLGVRMTGEDFAYFAELIPSTFFRLGVKNEKSEEEKSLHSPHFNVDESCFLNGIGYASYLMISMLKR